MSIQKLINEKKTTKYRLAKNSGIPYTTLNDICLGKTRIEKCSAETVYKLSKELGVTMEKLLEAGMSKRISFELFKSNVCHRVKEKGDVQFLIETLENDVIRSYWDREWFPESLYLLAMVDYLSRVNDVPLCEEYNEMRRCRLPDPLYPIGIRCLAHASGNEVVKERAKREAIPEFMRFNIVESEVRDVI